MKIEEKVKLLNRLKIRGRRYWKSISGAFAEGRTPR
jgi:hypothetical protein